MCALLARDSGGGDFEQAPAGNHIAVCYQVVDLGIQHGEYQGQPISSHQVVIAWELSSELMADGRPFTINKFYTLSLSPKSNLRPMLESWRGRAFTEQELQGFDLKNILGAPCMVNVIHKPRARDGAIRAQVGSVSALPKGMQKPVMANDPLFYSIEDDMSGVIFNQLPEWLQQRVNRQPQKQNNIDAPPPNFDNFDDDIPF